MSKVFVTRFAPSPTGLLHLGHAYSALTAYHQARKFKGRFILRIEDIDIGRCRPEFEDKIFEDLAWLGLKWEKPVRRQSAHFDAYEKAIARLKEQGLLYPCFCTRKEIAREIEKSASAPHGPEGPLYPGTCKGLDKVEVRQKISAGMAYALRLDVERAMDRLVQENKTPLGFVDEEKGPVRADPKSLGDVVIARKDVPTSYHLSVTVDDHLQGITHVIRGEDLFHATHIHRLLQALLDYPAPSYLHHELLKGKEGKRFAKRDKALTIRDLREKGLTPGDLMDLFIRFGGDPRFQL